MKSDAKDPLYRFWSNMSLDLFQNIRRIYEQIDAQFTGRSPEESVGAQMASFCVYTCGNFSTYLARYPNSAFTLPCI
jgi:hypothetical protein